MAEVSPAGATSQPCWERKEKALLASGGGREEVTRERSSVRGRERREGGREMVVSGCRSLEALVARHTPTMSGRLSSVMAGC